MTPCDTLRVSKAELDQSRFWTEAEYLALDEMSNRIELIDGRIRVTPPANNAHDQMAALLWDALRYTARAAKLETFLTPELRLAPGRIVIPDLAVGRFAWRTRTNEAADAFLVVEITSPSNARVDRGRKKRFYAEAKIGWYLLVEPDFSDYESVTMCLYRLDRDRYVEHAVAKQGETLSLHGLLDVMLNTDDLIHP
jgi:Uma2 family endonuclease